MSITLLVGPAASGKTHRCIERLLEIHGEQTLARTWAVLPDRSQVYAFRRRLAKAGGAIGAQIGTFMDLHTEILRAAGLLLPITSEAIVHRLLRSIIQQLQDAESLEYYGPISAKPGFLEAVRGRIAELKRAMVSPERLLKDFEYDTPLEDLGRIYQAYEGALGKLEWLDRESLDRMAYKALEAHPELASEWDFIAFDGFDFFSNAQLASLMGLGNRLPEVLITLPGEINGSRRAHRRFAQTLETLGTMLPGAQTVSSARAPKLPAALAAIERGLFEVDANAVSGSGVLECHEVQDPAQEAREALRWLKARIVRDKVPLYACAIIVPDIPRYQHYLQETAAEFQLPIRFTYGIQLSSAPGISILLEMLELAIRNWPRRATLDVIRSPYLDLSSYGLYPTDAPALEIASIFGQVIEGMAQWTDALARLAATEASPEDVYEESLGFLDVPRGTEAGRLMEALQGLERRLAPPDARIIAEWVRWIEDLLDELRFFASRDTARDIASHQSLRQALRALVLAESVAGESAVTYEVFHAELRRTLESATYREPSDWKKQKISVLHVRESPSLRFDALAVLGLAEGLFPAIEYEDPFLGENVRSKLGLEPRLGREQGSYFYQAITRADRFLLLSRPYLADDGELWESSPFWRSTTALLVEEPARLEPQAPRPLSEAASAEELLFWAVRRNALPSKYRATLLPRWEQLRHARAVLEARRASDRRSPHDGDLAEARHLISEDFGSNRLWSASRLESYGTCPHMFFVSYAMGLEAWEPPALGFDASQLGSMLHAILEQAYMQADDPADPDSVLARLRPIAELVFKTAPETYGFRPNMLWQLEQESLLESLEKSVRKMADEGAGWTPIGFERAFGLQGEPPLEIEFGADVLRLRGLVDRLDRNAKGELRIVDYKTGASHLAQSDLRDGRRLQLPLYALGARDALGLGEPVEGIYWAILAAKAGSLRLSTFKPEGNGEQSRGPKAAIDTALRHVERYFHDIQAGNFAPRPPDGGCPSYCPAGAWCWQYAPGWP